MEWIWAWLVGLIAEFWYPATPACPRRPIGPAQPWIYRQNLETVLIEYFLFLLTSAWIDLPFYSLSDEVLWMWDEIEATPWFVGENCLNLHCNITFLISWDDKQLQLEMGHQNQVNWSWVHINLVQSYDQ